MQWRMFLAAGSVAFLLALSFSGIPSNNVSEAKLSVKLNDGKSSLPYTSHAPIRINSNSDFTSENGVSGGSGTANDPYIIEGWRIEINRSPRDGIYVGNTNRYFIIRNCFLLSTSNITTCGIRFYNVSYGKIEHCLISSFDIGVQLGDHHENPGTNRCTVTHSIIENNNIGVDIWNSRENTITYCKITKNNMSIHRWTCNSSFVGIMDTANYYHRVHHNNFIDNAQLPSTNIPDIIMDDSVSEGNYWSDYRTRYPNATNNGHVWDTPYSFSFRTQDRYPLVNPVDGGTIEGTVREINSGAYVESVNITVEGTNYSAVTNSMGTYKITNVLAGVYDITAHWKQFPPVRKHNISVTVSETKIVNFDVGVLLPGVGYIRGVVKSVWNEPVSNASIMVGGTVYAVTNATGAYNAIVPNTPYYGNYEVYVTAAGFRPSPKYNTGAVHCEQIITLDFTLVPLACQIKGKVVDAETGQPIGAAEVKLITSNGLLFSALLTDQYGEFSILGLNDTIYNLTITKYGYQPFSISNLCGSAGEIHDVGVIKMVPIVNQPPTAFIDTAVAIAVIATLVAFIAATMLGAHRERRK